MSQRWSLVNLAAAARFLTRLRIRGAHVPLAEAAPFFPVVGLGVGAVAGAVFLLELPPLLAGFLAVALGALATGALHEDGLADTADGLGGGRDREHALSIMRDSTVGAYGALSLALSVALRGAALAVVAEPWAALVAAHCFSRAVLPAVMRRLPPARADGQAVAAGAPDSVGAAAALAIGAVATFLLLGPGRGLLAMLLAAAAAWLVARVARRKIGGYTGDVLGAVQQLSEITILVVAAA